MAKIHGSKAHQLGATLTDEGVNFAVYSEIADRIEVCLFDKDGIEKTYELSEHIAFVHHLFLPGIQAGQKYGYRVHGPWDGTGSSRCNPRKLLMDPYAKAISGEHLFAEANYAYDRFDITRMNTADNAKDMPRSVVVDTRFDWEGDTLLENSTHNTFIYEAHVKGLTNLHPDVPESERGTYKAIGSEPIIEHLTNLGVTALELMPVHHFVSEDFLHGKGLTNYWGYNTLSFFAPHGAYSSTGDDGQQVNEFKEMVKKLHSAGIEVILDVVYNHTAEGNHEGPHLNLKGFDNNAYYRIGDDGYSYVDYTGCGNSLNMRHPQTLKLVMDSLRYWVTEMHVDGFRFDLAAALARETHDVDKLSAFFDLIHQDPIISNVKLIAEPWDVGEGGYQVGNFPPLWSEWNGEYRDTVRDFWRGNVDSLSDFTTRITGSSDLYGWSRGRRPSASINFINSHDGFTMADLVSYDAKHNEANKENNKDGDNHNLSWNSGTEGPTDDEAINKIRSLRIKSMLTTLFLSQGVPMLTSGDEFGRSKNGNNNTYCQDNELTWIDWENIDQDLYQFTQRLARFRKDHPAFRRRRWFNGVRYQGVDDISWHRPDGEAMSNQDWATATKAAFSVFVNGEAEKAHASDEDNLRESFLMLFNASNSNTNFVVPPGLGGEKWGIEIDTDDKGNRDALVKSCDDWNASAWSVVILRRLRENDTSLDAGESNEQSENGDN